MLSFQDTFMEKEIGFENQLFSNTSGGLSL
jgi:hypothetical protein